MHAYHYGASLHVRRRPKRRVSPAAKTAASLQQALRNARVQSHVDLAQRLRLTPRAITTLEYHTDMYINHLRRCIESRGGTLDIVVHFPDGEVTITYFKDIDPTFRL